jgi:HSP20 family molecular chaperone IbpA
MRIQSRAGPKASEKITHAAPPTPPAWEPYFERLQEFERSLWRHVSEFFPPSRAAFRFEFAPPELRETERGFTVHAAVPGFKESEIEVRVEPWRLFLHAKHEESTEKKGELGFEEYHEFTRWVDFPAEVNPEKVKAVLSKGVLEVTLEKAQTARKVEVKAA